MLACPSGADARARSFIAGYGAHEERTRGLVEAFKKFGGQFCSCPNGRMLEPIENHESFCGVAVFAKALKEYEEPTQAKGD